MPTPSGISIWHVSREGASFSNGEDITSHVLFSTARFEAQSGGQVGTFTFTLKDVDRDLDWAYEGQINTGDQILLFLDSVRLFGGWIQQIGRTFAFPADDTSTLANVESRYFQVRGGNFNLLFDRLVAHRDSSPLRALPAEPGTTQAGVLVAKLCADYLDYPNGFNTSQVDNVRRIHPYDAEWGWKNGGEQGISFRDEMDWIRHWNAAIYYIDAYKRLHFHAPEKVFAPWGFSDRPNKRSVTVSQTDGPFTGATYPFRELDTTEDLTSIVNDVFVWGGSPWIASDDPEASGTVFARRSNATSINRYGRWQMAEVGFGIQGMSSQGGVDSRAEMIVPPNNSDIPPGIDEQGVIRNRSKPGWTLKLTWFAHDVPRMNNGQKRHLEVGEIVTIILYVHGRGAAHPLILTLPLRRISISFPTLPSNTGGDMETFVRFDGDFGLDLSDPHQLWEAIGDQRTAIARTVGGAGSPTTGGSPGAVWQGAPDENANGTRKTFTLSSGGTPIVYSATSSEVFLNGLRLRQGADYQEGPSTGKITVFVAPPTGSIFWITVRLAG